MNIISVSLNERTLNFKVSMYNCLESVRICKSNKRSEVSKNSPFVSQLDGIPPDISVAIKLKTDVL